MTWACRCKAFTITAFSSASRVGSEARWIRSRTEWTLIICGERDSDLIVEGSQRLAELIPGARLCVIARAAHSPQEERPEAFNAALRGFLGAGS